MAVVTAADIEVPERAITLIQPMGTAIVVGWKPIENRSWRPWPSIVGKLVAIHAGAKWSRDYLNAIGSIFARRHDWPGATFDKMVEDRCVQNAIIGVARVTGHVGYLQADCDVAVAPGDLDWLTGPYGWLLADRREVEPIPCRGNRGLWRIRDAERAVLRERLAVAA